MSAAAQPKEPFEVWIHYTVFVRKPGEQRPWLKRVAGPKATVQAKDQDRAMHAGEKELARAMAERFHLVGGTP